MGQIRLKFIDRDFDYIICYRCAHIVKTKGLLLRNRYGQSNSSIKCDKCYHNLDCSYLEIRKDHLLLRTEKKSHFYVGSFEGQIFAFFTPLTLKQVKQIYKFDNVKKYIGKEYKTVFKGNRGLSPLLPRIKEEFSNKYFLRYLCNNNGYYSHRQMSIRTLVDLALKFMY